MKINKYPDGSSYFELVSNEPKGNYTFRINSYEDLWHLNQMVDAHNNFFGEKPTVIIPNLIDAQADRRFNEGDSSGLKLVLKFLNGMDANFTIFHPHNGEVVEAMMDNVEIIDNSEFIKTLLHNHVELLKSRDNNNLILMSADAGGFKPLMKLCGKLQWQGETFSASKARTKDGMKQLVDAADFGGKDILIVDDISVYGGTFKGLSKLLKERNCGKLYLAVSHMTVQDLGRDSVTSYFDKVFTTNSKFDSYRGTYPNPDIPDGVVWTNQIENLEVIKMF